MKKLLTIIFSLLVMVVYGQNTQSIMINAEEVPEGNTPEHIVAAVKRDFPNSQVVSYHLARADHINTHWTLEEDHYMMDEEGPDHYTVKLESPNDDSYIYALYDKDGKLIESKVFTEQFPLPQDIVNQATSGKFEGYTIVSDEFYRVKRHDHGKEYIQVNIEKGKKHKKLFFSTDGNLMKVK
ncbi:hypothetical protein [Marinigracilibium pacificum]|uniref:Beta-lactamase-inhibitor-like PepSY-like domain-containing protein n=1 Tax=Marinigracilibium pacificum TaxID=2729599 RepID=A0A848IUG3_9BACT|nr:hypothetical protein [Marinigracilibium pacificum]NMM48143.1 hypothetical protein [Marinigracilibium pacificum]